MVLHCVLKNTPYCITAIFMESEKNNNSPQHDKNLLFIIFFPSSICLCVFTTSKGNVTTPAICTIMKNIEKLTIVF